MCLVYNNEVNLMATWGNPHHGKKNDDSFMHPRIWVEILNLLLVQFLHLELHTQACYDYVAPKLLD
jgi:hypothetical protein